MNINNLKIDVRIRSHWEAIDLGFILARQYWRPLFLSWAIPAAILFVFLSILLRDHSWLVPLIIWWLKPALDRFPLFVLSRFIFGENITLNSLFRKIWTISKTDWLPWLTYRRLSPSRSMDMPVTLLEELKSGDRDKRLRVLHRSNSHSAFWLTIILVHLEAVIIVAAYGFAALMIPEEFSIDFMAMIFDESEAHNQVVNLLSVIAMTLIAPFYVASGFCLYLNRRIDMEAWDVEIRFRQMSQQLKKVGSLVSVFLPIFLMVSVFCVPSPVSAEEQSLEETGHTDLYDSNLLSTKTSREIIDEVLAEDAFHKFEEVGYWRLKEKTEEDEEQEKSKIPQWIIELIKFWERISLGGSGTANFAVLFEFLLWVIAISIIGFFLYKLIQYLLLNYKAGTAEIEDTEKPKVLFGLDVTKESLPDDIPTETLNLWRQGHHRQALALLYRASLFHLMESKGIQFEESYTEGECLQAAASFGDILVTDYLKEVTQNWKNLAYGHIVPVSDVVEALCDRWNQVFENES